MDALKKNIIKVGHFGGVFSVKSAIRFLVERSYALKILNIDKKVGSNLGEFQKIEFDLEESFHRHGCDTFIGVDPGSRHMGFTWLQDKGKGVTYEILLPLQPDALSRMHSVRKMMEWILETCFSQIPPFKGIHAVVEGSGYSMPFGQTELAEARAIAMLTLDKYGIKLAVIVPNSVRKTAFGSAKIKADEIWKNLIPPNAASSIAMAMCASKL